MAKLRFKYPENDNREILITQIKENQLPQKAGGPSGRIIFKNLSKEQLNDFRIIPEDGSTLIIPSENEKVYCGNGVYFKDPAEEQYWYKVSAGGELHIEVKNGGNKYTGYENRNYKYIVEIFEIYYKVGFEPKSSSHGI